MLFCEWGFPFSQLEVFNSVIAACSVLSEFLGQSSSISSARSAQFDQPCSINSSISNSEFLTCALLVWFWWFCNGSLSVHTHAPSAFHRSHRISPLCKNAVVPDNTPNTPSFRSVSEAIGPLNSHKTSAGFYRLRVNFVSTTP